MTQAEAYSRAVIALRKAQGAQPRGWQDMDDAEILAQIIRHLAYEFNHQQPATRTSHK